MSLSVDGKWAEAEAQKWLNRRSERDSSFAWHRYPDARAARGALAAQPSDYIVGYWKNGLHRPVACHLEVKETEEVNRLPKGKLRQYGKLFMFNLAGFQTIVLVYRSTPKDWVFLSGEDLFIPDEIPKSFEINKGRTKFASAGLALDHIFK